MLGRLEMDVDECIAAFRETMKAVFEKKRNPFPISLMGNVKAKFSSKTLEAAIKRVIRDRHGIREDDLLYDQSADRDATRKCRV
jgi:ABC-type phosphate transport system ATPase subunit